MIERAEKNITLINIQNLVGSNFDDTFITKVGESNIIDGGNQGSHRHHVPGVRLSEELGQNAEGWGDHQEEDPEDDHGAGSGVHHLRAVGSVAVGPPK